MKDKYIFTSQVQTLFIIHATNWLEEIVRQPQGEGGPPLRHHSLARSTNVGTKVALRPDV